ncbi:MAG: hypothetical protein GXY65_18255 [Rhodococcus sp.]|uniref:hypothetical protein n=1 Tax=Rhodococcus sp. TaxID=1831 RepID=UPI0016AD1F92|nr:hypothetical protein [Rhodococcus sp. (in: high G+C Gram-positive bacteria)]NLV81243.1 hypothetical protein [Rhodococcus sp. (in: high G+C Gram-positive bacteria)]
MSAAAATLVLMLTACSDIGSRAVPVDASTQYAEATAALDRVRAAFDVMTTVGTMRSVLHGQDLPDSVTVADMQRNIVLTRVVESPLGPFDTFGSDDGSFIRYHDLPASGRGRLESGAWYRIDPDTIPAAVPMTVRDQQRLTAILVESITGAQDHGTATTDDGRTSTRFTATVDTAAYADTALDQLATDLSRSEIADARRMILDGITPTVELWVDDAGRILQQYNSGSTSINEFDVDTEFPDIDPDDVRDLPTR